MKSYEKVQLIKSVKVKRSEPGLYYQYFEGNWEGLPDFSELDCKKQGTTQGFTVGDIAVKKDYFGMRFSGFIEIPEDGMHHFRIRADDAGSLKIHDQLVCQVGIEGPGIAGVSDHGAIALKAGLHPVEIDFKELQGGERLRLYHKTRESANWNFMYLEDFFKTTNRKK